MFLQERAGEGDKGATETTVSTIAGENERQTDKKEATDEHTLETLAQMTRAQKNGRNMIRQSNKDMHLADGGQRRDEEGEGGGEQNNRAVQR